MSTPHPSYVAVVDDDESLCRSFGRLLRAAGMQPITYASAEAFLADTKHPPFDCLVLDIQLGGMSGIELAQRLTAEGGHPPFIFITAHDDTETRAKRAKPRDARPISRRANPGPTCSKPSAEWPAESRHTRCKLQGGPLQKQEEPTSRGGLMTELFIPVLCGVAGVSGYAAFLHGRLASRSPTRGVHLLFSVLCVLATLCMIARIGELGAEGSEDTSSLRQMGLAACMLYLALLPWFIRAYTGERRRTHLFVQSGCLLLIPVAEWLLSHGSTARYGWLGVLWAGIGFTLGWSLYASWRQFRLGMRRRALALGAGLLLLLATLLTHLLSDLGLHDVPRLGALGLAALLIPMSLELDRETRQSRSRLQAILENCRRPPT